MGGAPPPPLGFAPQAGRKAHFFWPARPARPNAEDQAPQGDEGDAPHHWGQLLGPERWFGFLHSVLL